MPLDAFYGYPFEGYPFDSLFAGGNISGSECYPRLVAVSPVVIFLAVTGAPHRCRGRRIIPACHDTDRCADSYVSRRVSGPKTRFSCHDTDRVGKWSVSRQAGGKQAFVGCLSRRRLSPKCARRTGHRQRGIRFLLRALALERPVCAAILRYTASGRSFVRALWRETLISGQSGGKHRSAEKSGDGYRRADYCFDTTTM